MTTSQWLLVSGIALQIIASLLFLWIAVNFDQRALRSSRLSSYALEMKHLRQLWILIYAATGLLMVRNAYRMARTYWTGCERLRCLILSRHRIRFLIVFSSRRPTRIPCYALMAGLHSRHRACACESRVPTKSVLFLTRDSNRLSALGCHFFVPGAICPRQGV